MDEVNESSLRMLSSKEALTASKISIIINTYDDIFSDFDPRPSSLRTLSDDFIFELRRAVRSKPSDSLEMVVLVPSKMRNLNEEGIIKKRIHEYFRKRHEQLVSEMNSERKKGFGMAVLGAAIGVLATTISLMNENLILKNALLVFLEPASWFTIWTGLDKIFLISDKRKEEIDFFGKMSRIEINFQSY